MRTIGITGGVGAGKSQILSFIREHYKCRICLADDVAKEIQLPGGICYEQIVNVLGRDVLLSDGSIDKGLMAKKIFGDKELLEKVNAIVHPGVRIYLEEAKAKEQEEGKVELFFVEAALLIENGYRDFVDEMWYIHADREVRIARLKSSRGYTDEKITQIMASQLSEEEFRNNSDFVIDNSKSLEEAYAQIKARLEEYTWQK